MNEQKSTALSYFKSFQGDNNNRNSRTGNLNNQKRNISQKRSLMVDAHKLHFMPVFDNNKKQMVGTVKNGWINNPDKDSTLRLSERSNRVEQNRDKMNSPSLSPVIVPKKNLCLNGSI